jgi:inward rectifier potassium channel
MALFYLPADGLLRPRVTATVLSRYNRDAMANADFEASPLAPRTTSEHETRDRDLGFGAVMGRQSDQRLLNSNGSFNVARTGLGLLATAAPYHQLLSISWAGFFGLVVASYLAFNFLFALAYLACGPEALAVPPGHMAGGAFSHAFFFSVQTFATIGYGQLAPNGFSANAIVTVEALVGLMFQALATGLLFARFSKPTASILFSSHAIIAPYNNGRSLQFRIANRRRNEIIQLEAQVMFSALRPDGRGGRVRRYALLPLERNKVTFFPLAWTIVHPIDDNSPLAGVSAADLEEAEAEVLVLLSGIDETFAQTVHARSSYRGNEILWDVRFRSIYVQTDGQAHVSVDISRLHDTEPTA